VPDCSTVVTRPLCHTSDGRPALPPARSQKVEGFRGIRTARGPLPLSAARRERRKRARRRAGCTRAPYGRARLADALDDVSVQLELGDDGGCEIDPAGV
jgi:hypothetical protein